MSTSALGVIETTEPGLLSWKPSESKYPKSFSLKVGQASSNASLIVEDGPFSLSNTDIVVLHINPPMSAGNTM